jgi:hypothetical protein
VHEQAPAAVEVRGHSSAPMRMNGDGDASVDHTFRPLED